jgi:hypothetical protein
MRVSLPHIAWFFVALLLALGINQWRLRAAAASLQAAQDGDVEAAESWVSRSLRESDCTLFSAAEYLGDDESRVNVGHAGYVESFLGKFEEDGATSIEVCEVDEVGFRSARYLILTLPDDARQRDALIADAQSFIRRHAVVYLGANSLKAEEIVRATLLVGTSRILIELPD